MLLDLRWRILQQFHKSLTIVNYHVASQTFVTLELTNITSQDYVIKINDPWKILVTSSAIPYLKIMYLIRTLGLPPRLGPPPSKSGLNSI